ncbi:MAG TPA: SgcJ/EcaC family oxidoreductase [Candidatus Acidoferrum sp.]|nr:SgcJ/EcaC family oxidoreductase [Candidatus Acidoferrum sp.]
MRRLSIALLSLLAVTVLPADAQTKADEEAVRKLPQAFSDAWAKHDGRELAKLMADDADFVTVATTYLHGRSDFEKFHVRLLSGRFKDSTLTPLQTTVRFLHPHIAVVHWSWKIEGDKNPDGTPRQPRYGMMTLVAEKRSGDWLVVVGQNTNAILGIPPELQDIKTPIAIPGTAPDPH